LHFFILWNFVATITAEPEWFWGVTWAIHFFASTFIVFVIYGVDFRPRNYYYELYELLKNIVYCNWTIQVRTVTIVIVVNWIVLGTVGALRALPFSEALLATILVNTISYYTYYAQQKRRSNEHRPLVNILLNYTGIIIIVLGLVSFTYGVTDKNLPPELNRQKNRDCILLDFFDWHDVWHFSTSYGLGFLFLGLQFVDEDVIGIERISLKVF